MTTQLPIPYDELPLWMRQARQDFDWSVLIALAMSIAIAWTFLLRDDLAAGNQLEHYIFQASDIVSGFEEGRFYPRWSPYAVRGYGAPIPNYYPMGTPYIVASIENLFTNDLIQAVRITFVLTYAVAGLGIYLLVSRRTDAPVGLLASVLYLYSPMIGSTVPYVMGDLALLMASALLPLSLWSTYRLISQQQAIAFALHSLIIALLLWIHPQMALISIIFGMIYTVFENLDTYRLYRIPRFTLATIAGCLLVSFFWMPAILESNLVNWYPLESTTNNLITLSHLLEPIQQIDSGLLMPQPQFKLGWVIIILSLVGIPTIWLAPNTPKRFYIFTIILGSLLLAFALIIAPDEVWLLVPITLCFSILGGSVLHLRSYLSQQTGRLLLVVVMTVTLVFSIPVWLVPATNITVSGTDVITQLRFEQQGFGISTLPNDVPLPSTIKPDSPVNRFLLNSYETNSPQRYEEQQNSARTIVSLLETATHQQTYRIFNAETRELSFIIPYFAGWQAFVGGKSIPTYANPDSGLLTIQVPRADNDELQIILGSTPIRDASWWISGTMLLIVLLIIVRNHSHTPDDEAIYLVETMPRSDIRLMLFMFACLGIVTSIFTSDVPPIQLQNPPAFTLSQSLPLQSRTSAGIEATTFDLSKRTVTYDEDLQVAIYWKALTSIQSNYKSRILLRNMRNGLIWYTGDLQYPSPIDAKRWVRNRYVADVHHIRIPSNLILGEYQILVEMYPCDITQCSFDNPVLFFDINGNLRGNQLEIPLIITVQ